MISQLARWAGAVCIAASATALAQGYPANPMRIIVPFAPGGNVDITARLIAPGLGEALGQPVVVENRPGAGGTIGADQVVKSPADGYTLLMGSNSTFSVAPSLYPRNPYNPLADFAPVVMIASAPFQEITGARFTHVPYKGSGQALTDLMGGQVDLHFDQITSAASHIQGGKLRALMVTAPERVTRIVKDANVKVE